MTADIRRMPSIRAIADHHGLGEPPSCFHCGIAMPWTTWARAGTFLDRAHVIDRCFGGSDHVENLRPLCHECHSQQPAFRLGDEAVALYWFTGRPKGGNIIRHSHNEYGEQMVFVHNGRMALLFHDDNLMPARPLIVSDAAKTRDIPSVGPRAICDGFLLGGTEASWLRDCLAEAHELVSGGSR